MRKRLLAIIATAAMVVAMVPAMAFAANADHAELQGMINAAGDGATITLTKNYAIDDTIVIADKNITIDGDGYSVTATSRKNFEVKNSTTTEIDVTFKDIKVVNNSNSVGPSPRAIDTRNGYIALTLDGVTLDVSSAKGDSTGYNPQGLTVGGNYSDAIDVTVKNSTIVAGDSGYGIITFNPVNLVVDNSNVSGYAAMYFKGVNSSQGSAGSVVTIKNSTVAESENIHNGASNAFGTIVFEDDDITINVDNSTISGTSTGDQTQTVFLENNEYATFTKANTVNIYNGSKIIADNSETIATVSATNKVVFKDATCSVEIPAEFIAEGYAQDKTTGVVSKIETNKPEASPATGDNSMAPIAVAGLVMAAMAAVVATRRRTN